MKKEITNLNASIRARLQNKAGDSGRPFEEVLQYFAMERFLYRFSQSQYKDKFILKGALMFTVWDVPERRATRDIDFIAHQGNEIAEIEKVMKDVCQTKVQADGLIFDAQTVNGQKIKEDADYEGVRIKFLGFLDRSQIHMQIDVGFGDAIYPKPEVIDYPVILDLPKPPRGRKGTFSEGKRMGVMFKNGNWFIKYRLPNGQRRQEKIGTSKKLADSVLCKRKTEIAEGKFLDVAKKEKIRFEVFADEYLKIHSKQHKKSWKTDDYIIRCLNKFFKGKFLFAITPKDIEHYKMERLKETVADRTISPATVNRELDVLSSIFNKAIVWGKLQVSPMRSVQSLKVPPGRLRFLEKEEIVKLLSNCTKNLRPIMVLALFTGMRRGEILGLKWHDIDVKRNIITLLNTKNGEKGELPMNEEVKTALSRVRKHPDTAYIFCNETGRPVHDIRKSYSTALEKSGITNFRFNDLRHTFASQLVMSGIDLNTVRELLGHEDMSMTLRYSHLAQSHKQHAVDVLGKKVATFWQLEVPEKTASQPRDSQAIESTLVTFSGK